MRSRAVACLLILGAPSVAARDHWRLEIGGGNLEGAGEGFEGLGDFEVRDFDSGRSWRIDAAWAFDERWYVRAFAARSKLRYGSPLDGRCPFSVGFVLGQDYCFADGIMRGAGSIEEDLRDVGLSIGYAEQLGEKLTWYVEAGARHSEWSSEGDTEARGLAGCRDIFLGQDFGEVEGCNVIRPEARETGVGAALGARAELGASLWVDVAWQYQSYRHRIWRTDVLDRFYEANCRDPQRCISRNNVEVADVGESSWHWYEFKLGVRLTEGTSVVLDLGRGGNRKWSQSSLALLIEF